MKNKFRNLFQNMAIFLALQISDSIQQTPLFLPSTVAFDYVWATGDEESGSGDYSEFVWTVPFKFYRLTNIEVTMDSIGGIHQQINYFRATFSPDPNQTTAWPDMTHIFGSTDTSGWNTPPGVTNELSFASEIIEYATCIDDIDVHDFSRFKFKEVGGNEQEEGAQYVCDDGSYDSYVDLPGRLIGFRIRTKSGCKDTDEGSTGDDSGYFCNTYTGSTNPSACSGDWDDDDFSSNEMCCQCGGGSNDPTTIRSIQMIVDDDNCEEAYWTADTMAGLVMNHEINAAETTHLVPQLETIWGQTDCAFTSTVTPSMSFITYDDTQMQLNVLTSDCSQVGVHPFSMTLHSVDSQPYVPDSSYSFDVNIACTLTSFEFGAQLIDVSYNIESNAYTGDFFSMAYGGGSCTCPDQEVITIIYMKDGVEVSNPAFVTNDPATDKNFIIQTNNSADAGIYVVTITASIPVDNSSTGNYWTAEQSFILTLIAPDPCLQATLTINSAILTSLSLSYDIGAAQHDEQFDDQEVTATPLVTGCRDVEYSVAHQTGSPISAPFSYNSATKTFSILSADPLDASTYQLRLSANLIGYSNTGTLDFEVTLVDTCGTADLTLDPSILSSTSISYMIGASAHQELLDDLWVTVSPAPLTDCVLEYSLEYQDGSLIDPSVFTLTSTPEPKFSVQSVDSSNAGLYQLKLKVNYAGYSISDIVNFDVTLIDTCESATVSINSAIISSLAITYDIGATAHLETLLDTHFEATPAPLTACPDVVFELGDQAGDAVDGAIFAYDLSTQIFSTHSTDTSKALQFPLRITAHFSGYTNTVAVLDFTVTLVDLCDTAELTINPGILTSLALSYTIGDDALVEILQDTQFVSSPLPILACPDVVFTVEDQSGDAIDGEVFAYDLSAQIFTIYSDDYTKAGEYEMRIKAQYDGFTNVATLDFEVTLLNACQDATLTINSAILTSMSLSYDIGDTQHDEMLNDQYVTANPLTTGCPDVEYSVAHQTGSALITPFFFNSATKTFSILSADPLDASTYQLRLSANLIGYSNTGILDFEVTLVDTCSTAVLTLDPSILSSTSISYMIGASAHEELLDYSWVTVSPAPLTDCVLEQSLEYQDGSLFDPSVFTYTPWSQTLSVQSADSSKAGLYQLRLKVNYAGYSNSGTLNFEVQILESYTPFFVDWDQHNSLIVLSLNEQYNYRVPLIFSNCGNQVDFSIDLKGISQFTNYTNNTIYFATNNQTRSDYYKVPLLLRDEAEEVKYTLNVMIMPYQAEKDTTTDYSVLPPTTENSTSSNIFQLGLTNSLFPDYSDQFKTLLVDGSLDDSIANSVVPNTGAFTFNNEQQHDLFNIVLGGSNAKLESYFDPFACYFMNQRLTDTGEFEQVSRSDCKNEACKLCDQYFSHIDERMSQSSQYDEIAIDGDLLFIVEQSVMNSLSTSQETSIVIPTISQDKDYEEFLKQELAQFNVTQWLRETAGEDFNDFDTNTQAIEYIEAQYVVPKVTSISDRGVVRIEFSGTTKQFNFTETVTNFLAYGTSKHLQNLHGGRRLTEELLQKETDDTEKVSQLLKLTNSIRVTLIPNGSNYLDEKMATWSIQSLHTDGMDIQLEFEHPMYISWLLVDSIKVGFYNTEFYLMPSDQSQDVIPSGYSLVSELPKMQYDQMFQLNMENAKNILSISFITTYAAGISAQNLFAMIKNLQYSVHIALYDIEFTHRTWRIFRALLSCVQFDFLPLHEYLDYGFTETTPWNPRFALLGYDSCNVVEVLGSITIYIALKIIRATISHRVHKTGKYIKNPTFRNLFDWAKTKQEILKFTLELFLELMIGSLMILGMNKIQQFTVADYVAITLQVLVFIWCTSYFIFVLWFSFYKARQIQKNRLQELTKWYNATEKVEVEDDDTNLSEKTKVKGFRWKHLKVMAMKPDYKTTLWYNSCTEAEQVKVYKLVKAQKAQGNMKAVVYVPDAFDEEAEVEQIIEMIEEQKEATDFRIEENVQAGNQIVEEKNENIIIFQPEEEKKDEPNQSEVSSGFNLDVRLFDPIHEEIVLHKDKMHETVYAPLILGLNTSKLSGLCLTFIRAFRCIIIIVVAMMYDEKKYVIIQVITFMILSLLTVFFLGSNKPYISTKSQVFEIANESMVTVLSYFATVQLIFKDHIEIGGFINWTIYIHIALNLIVIVPSIIYQLIIRIRAFFISRKVKQFKQKLAELLKQKLLKEQTPAVNINLVVPAGNEDIATRPNELSQQTDHVLLPVDTELFKELPSIQETSTLSIVGKTCSEEQKEEESMESNEEEESDEEESKESDGEEEESEEEESGEKSSEEEESEVEDGVEASEEEKDGKDEVEASEKEKDGKDGVEANDDVEVGDDVMDRAKEGRKEDDAKEEADKPGYKDGRDVDRDQSSKEEKEVKKEPNEEIKEARGVRIEKKVQEGSVEQDQFKLSSKGIQPQRSNYYRKQHEQKMKEREEFEQKMRERENADPSCPRTFIFGTNFALPQPIQTSRTETYSRDLHNFHLISNASRDPSPAIVRDLGQYHSRGSVTERLRGPVLLTKKRPDQQLTLYESFAKIDRYLEERKVAAELSIEVQEEMKVTFDLEDCDTPVWARYPL